MIYPNSRNPFFRGKGEDEHVDDLLAVDRHFIINIEGPLPLPLPNPTHKYICSVICVKLKHITQYSLVTLFPFHTYVKVSNIFGDSHCKLTQQLFGPHNSHWNFLLEVTSAIPRVFSIRRKIYNGIFVGQNNQNSASPTA